VDVTQLVEQRVLEEVLTTFKIPLMFPCDNMGCDKRLPWNVMDEHRALCSFRTYRCPLSCLQKAHKKCTWEGQEQEIVGHMIKEHQAMSMDEPYVWFHPSVLGTQEQTTWVIPSLDLMVISKMLIDNVTKRHAGFNNLHVYSLAKRHLAVRVTTTVPDWGYDLNVVLRAPSMLRDPAVTMEMYMTTERCMNTTRFPMSDTTELTMYFYIEPDRKRKDVVDLADKPDTKRARVEDQKDNDL